MDYSAEDVARMVRDAKEEGRREGMEQAENIAYDHCGDIQPNEHGEDETCGRCEWCMVAQTIRAAGEGTHEEKPNA